MDKKFQQITIIISSDDFGGDSTIPPLDILCQMMSESPDLDLISIQDVKDMHLTITEVD